MKVLIVAATRAEVGGLISSFQLPEGNFITAPGFDLLVTGVGMTATAFALGQHLSAAYSLVVNLGIAGCYNRQVALGTVVNVVADQFAELGAENKDEFLTIDELGFGKSVYHNLYNQSDDAIANLRPVHGITVNKVHGNKDSIAAVTARLNPVTESMEGAAIFYSCSQMNIPCLQIRSISNYVEERNRTNWEIGHAVKKLNEWAIEFLTNR
jgi:futalosine hydrolase